MDDLKNNLLYIGFGVVGISTVLYCFSSYIQVKNLKQKLRKLPIVSWSQLKLKQNTKQTILVKTSCKESLFQQKFKFDIGSNQILLQLFPLTQFRSIITSTINASLENKTAKYQWRDPNGNPQQLPHITNDTLIKLSHSYQSVFDSDSPPGFFGTIFKYFLAVLAVIPEFLFQGVISGSTKHTPNHPVFSGPTWGTLAITSSLITNTPFILCCHFENGKLIPQLIAQSKGDILNYFQSKQNRFLIVGGISIFILTLIYKIKIKQIYSHLRGKISIKKASSSYSPKVDEQQTCIICYNHCRNIIFKKCKHLILCSACAKDIINPVVNCPMCREEIDNEYIQICPT